MAIKPWMTSDDIIAAVKRKISVPISQNTFSEEDILSFANEEMMISQVPSVLEYHEEFFVTTTEVEIQANKSNYSIPDRAIGLKLRDIFFKDQSGNLFEMTRVNSDDRAFFQGTADSNQGIYKFYIQGNDVNLLPTLSSNPNGSLIFAYFLRPNQLVKNNRAATITNFIVTVSINNLFIAVGNTVTIGDVVFTCVAGIPAAPGEFQIGGTALISASNLSTAVTAEGTYSSTVVSNVVTVKYQDVLLEYDTNNLLAFALPTPLIIEFDLVPNNIIDDLLLDFLQTKPGHKIMSMSVEIGIIDISGNTISFDPEMVPDDLIIGDYVCLENECIIPLLPPDLHISLVERTCARILAALGDQSGLQTQMLKIQEVDKAQGSLIDNRVEGAPQKVTARKSLLRCNKFGR